MIYSGLYVGARSLGRKWRFSRNVRVAASVGLGGGSAMRTSFAGESLPVIGPAEQETAHSNKENPTDV